MAHTPTISLCMIVRDEEDCIEQAISSVLPIVDEIIVIDTGSTDKTLDIVSGFDATIQEEEWQDDFSIHRNNSIKLATGDWILVLDADEAIDSSQHDFIKKIVQYPSNCYLLTQRHYTGDQRLSAFEPCKGDFPMWERNYLGYFDSHLCRLFPNDSRIEYRGKVHELVEHSIGECDDLTLMSSPILLHHYGHTTETKRKKNKSALYTPLGEKKVEEEPTTWKGFFELGVEHNCNGRIQESAEALKKATDLNPEYLPAWVNYGYVLTELKRYKEASEALQRVLDLAPDNPEAHCNMGVTYMRKNNYQSASRHFLRAVELKPDYLNAYSNLGTCLMKLGRVEEASRVFHKAYGLAPNNTMLLVRYGYALLQIGLLEDARRILTEVVNRTPEDPVAWQALGTACKELNQKREAAFAFRKAHELSPTESE